MALQNSEAGDHAMYFQHGFYCAAIHSSKDRPSNLKQAYGGQSFLALSESVTVMENVLRPLPQIPMGWLELEQVDRALGELRAFISRVAPQLRAGQWPNLDFDDERCIGTGTHVYPTWGRSPTARSAMRS